MQITAEQEVFQELRSERLWRIFEQVSFCVVCGAVGLFMLGLCAAATIVFLDAASDAPQIQADDGE